MSGKDDNNYCNDDGDEPQSQTPPPPPPPRRAVARARWGLLRAALMGIPPDESDRKASIHCFPGFQLLSRQVLLLSSSGECQEGKDSSSSSLLYRLRQRLLLSHSSRQDVDVESLLWAIHSCQDQDATTTAITTATKPTLVKIPSTTTTSTTGGGGVVVLSEQVRADLASKGIILCRGAACAEDATSSASSGQQGELCAWLPPNTDYVCVNYPLSSHQSLCIRERLPQQQQQQQGVHVMKKKTKEAKLLLLEALVSQQHYDGVDNTGNTRVWDSELSLTYCLFHESSSILSVLGVNNLWDLRNNSSSIQQQQQQGMDDEPPPSLFLHVLELGAGMAGLAGMALSIQNPRHTRVVLTDGHPDAVRNNRVNILLTQALYPSCVHLDITAQRLLWTTTTQQQHDDDDDNDSTIPNNTELFDLVLASDCTHFQEFHASLALTTAHQLRIGGVAIFLAPPRGDSLERFVALCQSLNGLFDVHWLKDGDDDYSETLSKLHHHHYHQNQKNGKPPYYNANIHCPHLLILRKRRCVEESDRHYALLLLHNT